MQQQHHKIIIGLIAIILVLLISVIAQQTAAGEFSQGLNEGIISMQQSLFGDGGISDSIKSNFKNSYIEIIPETVNEEKTIQDAAKLAERAAELKKEIAKLKGLKEETIETQKRGSEKFYRLSLT